MEQLNTLGQFFFENREKLLEQSLEHIGLTFISLLLAAVLSIPLGIWVSKHTRWASWVLGFVGIFQTIPSIALLGFLLPFMGIGVQPAIFCLFLYALLPILRNTYTGIQEVDASVKEAALGMGLSPGQLLRKVELPLALPVIFAGLRTAAVINVGVATLAAYIGAGGLGEFIFGGIALNNTTMIWAGAIPAALLAILFDQSLALLQRWQPDKWVKNVRFVILLIPILSSAYYWPQVYSPHYIAGFEPEFVSRKDGYPNLQAIYGLKFNTQILNNALMYKAVQEGEVDVISGYSTDGRILAYQLRVLEDDQYSFPPYYCSALIRKDVAEKYPEIVEALNRLSGLLTDSVMTSLNYKVDFNKLPPAQVAQDFLKSVGLWQAERSNGGEKLAIGSKIFTEQYILAEMFGQLIEGVAEVEVDIISGLGGTKICFEALQRGDIGLYPEYTGTGLLVLLSPPDLLVQQMIRDKDAVFEYVSNTFESNFQLLWLDPLGFNNTYALMIRDDIGQKKGIRKISDMVD